MSGNGNRCSKEFKADAIRMVKGEGRTINSVADDLGINDQTLRNWINKDERKQDPVKSKYDELEHELKMKQKKIDELEEAVDILKKATALFVRSNRK